MVRPDRAEPVAVPATVSGEPSAQVPLVTLAGSWEGGAEVIIREPGDLPSSWSCADARGGGAPARISMPDGPTVRDRNRGSR
jgi:hypothetical protein